MFYFVKSFGLGPRIGLGVNFRYQRLSVRVRIVNTGSSGRIYTSPYSVVFGLSPGIAPMASMDEIILWTRG